MRYSIYMIVTLITVWFGATLYTYVDTLNDRREAKMEQVWRILR